MFLCVIYKKYIVVFSESQSQPFEFNVHLYFSIEIVYLIFSNLFQPVHQRKMTGYFLKNVYFIMLLLLYMNKSSVLKNLAKLIQELSLSLQNLMK